MKKKKNRLKNTNEFSMDKIVNEQASSGESSDNVSDIKDDDLFRLDFDADFFVQESSSEPALSFDLPEKEVDLSFGLENSEQISEFNEFALDEIERNYSEAFSDAFTLMRTEPQIQLDDIPPIQPESELPEIKSVEEKASSSAEKAAKVKEAALAELDNIEPFPGELSNEIDPVAIYREVFDELPSEEIQETFTKSAEEVSVAAVEEITPVNEVPEDLPVKTEAVSSKLDDQVAAILSELESVDDLLAGMDLGDNILGFVQPEPEIPEPEEVQETETDVDALIESILAEQRAAVAKAEEEANAKAQAESESREQAEVVAKADAIINDIESDKISAEAEPDEQLLDADGSDDELMEDTRPALSSDTDGSKFVTYYNDEIMDEGTRRVQGTAQDSQASDIELASTDTRKYESSVGIDDAEISPADYARDDDYEALSDAESRTGSKDSGAAGKTFRDFIVTPVVSALAFIAMKVQQSRLSFRASPSQESEALGEEMAPNKAAAFYNSHLSWLRIRSRIALITALALVYISYGLPVFGALYDVGVKSAVCLILLLTSMITGIDIISSGIMSLIRRRPNANSLISVSALLCVIDAFIIAAGGKDKGLPFCAIPALTIAFSLLGSVINCRINRLTFNTAATMQNPYILTAETSVSGEGITLLKSKRGTKDFVRRVEEAGPDETVFAFMAPYLMAVALIFSLIVTVSNNNFSGFAHILSGIFAAAAPVVMLIAFPLPFFVSAKGLIKNGSAIAGWSGLYDIGKSQHIIISDSDLFSKGNVKIERVRILSGINPAKVISYTGSIIAASGSTLAPAFSELMKKGNGTFMRVDEFTCHESGGLIAMVDGEQVYCGTAAFMQLMGVRLPQKIMQKSSVFVAAGGVLCGIFEMEYTVTDKSKAALYSLMSSNRHPIFALRDFNLTPQMLSTKFDIATDGFDFPSFPERYEISGAVPSEESKPSAIISRDGLSPLVDLADHGRRLYSHIRVCVLLSVLCTVIGMITMFVLSLMGKMSLVISLTYMLLWLVPVTVLSFIIKMP